MKSLRDIKKLQARLQQYPNVEVAILFGSLAKGEASFTSDVDIAVQMDHVMNAKEKLLLIEVIALTLGRTVDLVDLKTVGQPLFAQIMQHGKRLIGDDRMYAELLNLYVVSQTDFFPYRQRILDERRRVWIGC